MKDYEARHIYMAIAIGILVLSPYLLLLFPLFLANALYKTTMTWFVTLSGTTYLFYGIGLLLLFIAALILFLLSLSQTSKKISVVCLVFGVLFIAHGTQQFMALSGEKISFQESLWDGEQQYSWDDIDEVIYRENRLSGKFAEFEFHFNDGKMMKLKENKFVEPWHKAIKEKLSKHDKDFIRK